MQIDRWECESVLKDFSSLGRDDSKYHKWTQNGNDMNIEWQLNENEMSMALT